MEPRKHEAIFYQSSARRNAKEGVIPRGAAEAAKGFNRKLFGILNGHSYSAEAAERNGKELEFGWFAEDASRTGAYNRCCLGPATGNNNTNVANRNRMTRMTRILPAKVLVH